MWADDIYGGAGVADFRYEQILIEENVRYGDARFFISLHNRLVGPYIGELGTDEQRHGGCRNASVVNRYWLLGSRNRAPAAMLQEFVRGPRTRAITGC